MNLAIPNPNSHHLSFLIQNSSFIGNRRFADGNRLRFLSGGNRKPCSFSGKIKAKTKDLVLGNPSVSVEKGKYSYDVESLINKLSSLPPRGSIARCLDIFKNKLSLNDFALVFKEFAGRGDWQRSLRLFKYMQRQIWCKPNEHIYTIMISLLGREGLLDKCLEVFDEMPSQGVSRSVFSYTALINAYGRNGRYETSLELLDRMKNEKISPSILTYNTVIMPFPKFCFWQLFSCFSLSDVCHQGNGEEDDDDDEENSIQQVLLEKSKSKPGSSNASDRRKCCSFHGIHVGTRQKFVVAAIILVFILMISFAILIWIASGKNPMNSSLLAEVYVDIFAAIILITGGGICFYGLRLLFNLRKVRSEQVSSEMRKVSGLAGVSVVCFTVSSLIALLTHIPLFYHWNPSKLHGIKALVLLIIYYFIGSTVPLAFVLWVLRELPPQNIVSRQEDTRRITYVNYETVPRQPQGPQQDWASATVSKNQLPGKSLVGLQNGS